MPAPPTSTPQYIFEAHFHGGALTHPVAVILADTVEQARTIAETARPQFPPYAIINLGPYTPPGHGILRWREQNRE